MADVNSMNWQQVLDQANTDFAARRYDEARKGYLELVEQGEFLVWSLFSLGRIARDASRPEEAAAYFEQAIAHSSEFFWAHYERIALWNGDESQNDKYASLAGDMVNLTWENLNPIHVNRLEAIGHRLWDNQRRELGARILEKLWPSQALGELALVRIVEIGASPEVRHSAAQRLEDSPKLSAVALRILAEHYRQCGDCDAEIACLERFWEAAPQDFQAFLLLAKAYVAHGDVELAEKHLAAGTRFPARQQMFARLIVAIEAGDVPKAFTAFRNHTRLYAECPKFPGIRLAYALGDLLETVKRDEVIGLLLQFHPGSSEVALLRLNEAIRDQNWEIARRVYDTHFEGVENLPQNVRLARIQMIAHTGDLALAAELVSAEIEKAEEPPLQIIRSALFIFAELGRWEEVFEVGKLGLEAETSFQQFFSVIVRAARRTGRVEDLFDLMIQLPRPLNAAQLSTVHALMEDLVEAGRGEVLHRAPDIEIPQDRLYRFRIKERNLNPVEAPPKDIAIYYCADETYMLPALVSLTSLALSNISLARRASFSFVVESDLVEVATASTSNIASRLGLSIQVVSASDIISSRETLRTEYGIFTGGQTLSLAAYYRIFFAKYLADQGLYDQALYIDSDTTLRGGLESLFDEKMTQPLMARRETDRAEVRHAMKVHGMKGTYFNSGVLRFDLRHPEIPRILDAAISHAGDPEVNLIFQDQCALNLAFDEKYTEMDERFNYFITPDISTDQTPAEDAVILHYLDRPKPWDGLYRRCARDWFEWFDLVGTFQADELFAKSAAPSA